MRCAVALVALVVGVSCGGESRSDAPDRGLKPEMDAGPDAAVCESGARADCNRDAADGCEVELASNGDHCGACEIGCGLAACIDGLCGVPPERVASADRPCKMVTDGETVYWALCASHQIVGVAANGGSNAEVVAIVTGGWGWFNDLAIDDEAVYWSKSGAPDAVEEDAIPGGIGRLVKNGGTPEHLITEGNVRGIALDGDRIYWTRSTAADDASLSGAILEGSKSGEVLAFLARIPGEDIVVDEAAIYFHNPVGPSIARLEKTGGEPRDLAPTLGLLSGLAAHEGHVYWSDGSGLWRVPRDGGAAERIDDASGSFTIDGGTIYYERHRVLVARREDRVTPLARVAGTISGMVVASGYLYFADFNADSVSRILL